MAASKKRMTAVSEDFGGELLGRLATFTLPDEGINGAKAVRIWHKHGLDVNMLPNVRQPTHVFQSACRSVETRRKDNGHVVEIKVDEVLNDANECVYQVTRMVRNKAEKLIEHPKAMRVNFDKALGTITVDALEDYAALSGVEEAIRAHVDKNAKRIPGQKVRNAVRDTLLGLGAQNLRRKAGGLYFVPSEYRVGDAGEFEQTKPLLDGMKAALSEMFGERADFYTIPVASDEDMKAMVRKHFVINVNEQAAELTLKALNRVRQGKGDRGVRSDLVANLWNDRRRLSQAIRDYKALVGDEMKDLEANVADLDKALEKLDALASEGVAA